MFLKWALTDPIYYLRVVVIIIISIVCHELAHGYAALSQGDDTPKRLGHLTLNPIVHMGTNAIVLLCLFGITWGQMPVSPSKFRNRKWGEIFVSAAGPVSNLILCFMAIFTFKIEHQWLHFNVLSSEFLFMFAAINFTLFWFNFLPIPPLDGYFVLKEFFPGLKGLGQTQYSHLYLWFLLGSGFISWLGSRSSNLIFQLML